MESRAEVANRAYEQALTIAREASEETERKLRHERIMCQKAQDFNRPPPLLQVLYPEAEEDTEVPPRSRAAVSYLVDLMHGREGKK